MNAQTKARLIAAIAFPLLASNVVQARPLPPAAAAVAPVQRFPHISIEERGRPGAPVVILIPGLSSPAEVWAGIAPALARDHRVVLVQVNGFGGDEPGDNLKPGLLDGIVADLHGYLIANKLGRPAVIGHAMGGLVGLMLARAHPGDVRQLMVVDALPFIGTLFAPGATVPAIEPQARMMRDAMAARYGQPADPAASRAVAVRLAATPEAQAKVAAWAAKADPRVSARAMYEDMTTDLRPALGSIVTPITLVYPTSTAVPADRAATLYRSAYAGTPHVAFVPVADSAHFVMLDQPVAFAKAVGAFLK